MSEFLGSEPQDLSYGKLSDLFAGHYVKEHGRATITLGYVTGSIGDRETYGPVLTEVIGQVALLNSPENHAEGVEEEVDLVKASLSDMHYLRAHQQKELRQLRPSFINDTKSTEPKTAFTAAAIATAQVLTTLDHEAMIIADDILAARSGAFQRIRQNHPGEIISLPDAQILPRSA